MDSIHPQLKMAGNVLSFETDCDSVRDLDDLLRSVLLGVPVLLNIEITDSPFFAKVSGRIEDVNFRWELSRVQQQFMTTTQEDRHQDIAKALARFQLVSSEKNRSLLAALQYFHTACRLNRSGNTQWEFMSEQILNYEKMLDSLFVSGGATSSRDQVRKELEKLGYSSNEIESSFVPILLLRDYLDVAHPSFALVPSDLLPELNGYIEALEGISRELIRRTLERVESGEYVLPREPIDVQPSSDNLRFTENLKASLSKWKA